MNEDHPSSKLSFPQTPSTNSFTIRLAPITLIMTLFINYTSWINLNIPFFLHTVNQLLEYDAIDGSKISILIFSLRNSTNLGNWAFGTEFGCRFHGVCDTIKITIDATIVGSRHPILYGSNKMFSYGMKTSFGNTRFQFPSKNPHIQPLIHPMLTYS